MRIVHICGALCSGKSSLAQDLHSKNVEQGISSAVIEVSSIVKQLIQERDRAKLQESGHLIENIISHIQSTIDVQSNMIGICDLFIVGARQSELLEQIPGEYIWLSVNSETRLRRYLNRNHIKDVCTKEAFDQACLKDIELGLTQVKEFIFSQENDV